jgi:adenosylcobinamide-GDP ribazoletransferase
MNRHAEHFFLALGFYTRIPCPTGLNYDELSKAAVFLPIIGWLVGGASALVFVLSASLLPPVTAVILALITGILLTGAFHEDGFADVCDGFGGGYGKQRILEIMKDSAIGVYGALGLIVLISLRISLLSSFPPTQTPGLIVAGHSISRLMPLLVMSRYKYVRLDNSKSGSAMIKPAGRELMFASITALLPFALVSVEPLIALIPVTGVTVWLSHYFDKHIGGYTGDCLGACQQIAETVFYLAAAALWTSI